MDNDISSIVIDDSIDYSSPQNSYIDSITLQCFSNKSSYNKYLTQTNNDHANTEHINKVKQYKYKITELLQNYLNNPIESITLDIDNAMENFSKTCIQHFEMKELEEINNLAYYESSNDNNNDEDIMFGKIDNNFKPSFQSFWGKGARKI